MGERLKVKHHDWHHRKPRSLGGTNDQKNMSQVKASKHQAWHLLFKNHDPYQIATYINNVWLDPDYEFVVKRKEVII